MLTQEEVKWAYRILLDRECESDEMIEEKIARLPNRKRLREDLLCSIEYHKRESDHRRFITSDECIVIKETDRFRIYLDLSDYISMEIANDNYDLQETQFVINNVKVGNTVLDLGAHVGYYTFLLASLVGENGKVYSFEPQLHLFTLIQQSIKENGYKGRIIAENCCVGSLTKKGQFAQHQGAGDYGCTHMLTSALPFYDDMTVESIDVINLDDYHFPSAIDFMKIDIEGSEYLALKTFKDRLKKDKPIILSEVNKPLLAHVSKVSSKEYITLLRNYGYECYVLNNDRETRERIDDTSVEYQNVIFLPKGNEKCANT